VRSVKKWSKIPIHVESVEQISVKSVVIMITESASFVDLNLVGMGKKHLLKSKQREKHNTVKSVVNKQKNYTSARNAKHTSA